MTMIVPTIPRDGSPYTATPIPAKDPALIKAANDFEAAFITQMLKFSGFDKALVSSGAETVAPFTDFLLTALAQDITEAGGFGLADRFYENISAISAQKDEGDQGGA